MDGLTFSKSLLNEKYVVTIHGGPFGLKNYTRFSSATHIEDIKRGIERLKEWVS